MSTTMLFGRQDAWFDSWTGTADLYLFLDTDLPWVADGTRLFGTHAERARFRAVAMAELTRRDLPFVVVRGQGAARYEAALHAIEAALA